MRLYAAAGALLSALLSTQHSSAFIPSPSISTSIRPNSEQIRHHHQSRTALSSTTENAQSSTSTSTAPGSSSSTKKKKLGLITFDLDDTLYPIAPVLDEANAAFSNAMSNFGYVDIAPSDIVEAGKQIRASLTAEEGSSSSSDDPLKPSTVNHKEIRLAAIRKEMEGFILKTKLRQTAEDWATDVEDLTSPVRKSAEKWARTTVHSSVVQAVYNAWEMERHHAAERHLYPDAISTIKQIQSDHPNVIIGAVTDGSANPMLMVFSLMPLFDFTVSWEDDMGEIAKLSQMEQFQELSEVDKSDGLSWIYRLAVEKGKAMSRLTDEMATTSDDNAQEDIEWCWVHVGDDLAYDVGGSATIGAKTVLVELSKEYGQTARSRVDGERPPWATESIAQTKAHQKMSLNALEKVDARISKLSELPEVINELLKGE